MSDFGDLKHIPLEQIDRDPSQPRQTFNDDTIRDLAASIDACGLVEPLVVKHNPFRQGRYVLVAGERRFRAVTQLDWRTVPCIVKPGQRDTFLESLIENLNREDLNPIDEALAIQRLRKERNMSWQRIHEATRRSVPTLMAKVRLLELPEEIQAMVRTGTLPQVSALGLAQYKGPTGDLIRLAYDLVAGRAPGELEKAPSEHGEMLLRAKLPSDPVVVFKRIMANCWRARSQPALIKLFLDQPEVLQKGLLRKLNAPARSNLLRNLRELSEACLQLLNRAESIFAQLDEEAARAAQPKPAPARVPVLPPPPKPADQKVKPTRSGPTDEQLRRIEQREAPPPTPRFATPPERRAPEPPPIVPTKPGDGWKSQGGSKRPHREPRPEFTTSALQPAFARPVAPVPVRSKVEAKHIDLTTFSAKHLDEAAELLYRVFTFRNSRTPAVQREKRFLSRVTGVPEDQVEARVQEALLIARQLWVDGNGFAHEAMLRCVATLKRSSVASTFEEFYTVVPTDIKDSSYISFQPLL